MNTGQKSWGKKIVSFAVCGMMVLQLTSCGYILHPERRGNRNHGMTAQDLDWKVMGLDLLFGLVVSAGSMGGEANSKAAVAAPMLIAPIPMLVDMFTGCIWMPSYSYRSNLGSEEQSLDSWRMIAFDSNTFNQKELEKVLTNYVRKPIHLNSPDFLIFQPDAETPDLLNTLTLLQHDNLGSLHGKWLKGSDVKYVHDASGRLVNVELKTTGQPIGK